MPSRTGNEEADKKLQEYETAVLNLCAEAMAGRVKRGAFQKEFIRIANYYTRILFMLGGADMESKEANAELDRLLKQNEKSAKKMTADIFKGKFNAE